MSANRSCLIVGAGIAGLTAAAALEAEGWAVVLLGKGRGPGGRMATRRIGESRLDHGAQFFTVRDARFREAAGRWEQAGWVAPWFSDGGHVRYRAAGGMNALAKHLAKPFDLRTEAKVKLLELADEGWQVTTESGQTLRAGALVLTPPAPQAIALLAACSSRFPSEISSILNAIVFDPCFALLVTIDGPGLVPSPGYIRPDQGPVEWIADNTQKGVSTGAAALTIHARADFSLHNLEAPQEYVAKLLLEAAKPWFGGQVTAWQLHRWRYSRPVDAGRRPACLFSRQPACLAIAGDAFGGSRLEGAFLSGLAAAESIGEAGS
ncbi:MAG: FAD-dependent oxidoreductase [Candidatus Solibacter sp.]|nr:FAD-dependent oxidoreductase [Candidatus Solibacter sp.]